MACPNWLARLGTGAFLVAIAFLPPAILLLSTAVLGPLSGELLTPVASFALMASVVLMLAGWWMLSSPASYGALERYQVPALAGQTFVSVFALGMLATMFTQAVLRPLPGISLVFSGFALLAIGQLMHLCILFRMRTLLDFHDKRWMRKATVAALWCAIALLAFPCFAGDTFVALIEMVDQAGGRRTITRIVVMLILIVSMLFWLRLAIEFRRLRTDAELAWSED